MPDQDAPMSFMVRKDAQVLVLFDLDGTLITMWPVHERAYEAMLNELYGVPNVNFRDYYKPGGTNEDNVRVILKALGFPDEFANGKIDRVVPTLKKYYLNYVESSEVTILPGVVPLLEELMAQNATIGIVTGNVTDVCELILRKSGLEKYFEFVIGGDTDPYRRGRLVAGTRMVSSAPGSNVYFFDDSDASIPISRELGIKSVAVETGETKHEDLAKASPDYLLKNLSDTRLVLGVIFGGDKEARKKVTR